MRVHFVAATALWLSLAGTARAAESPPHRSPWEGFGVGSYVQFRSTMKIEGVGKTIPDDVTETRETVVKVTEDAHTIRHEKKTAAGWTKTGEVDVPRKSPKPDADVPQPEVEDLGTEKLTVEGKAIECIKVRTRYGDTTSTTWFTKAHGVLKYESENGAGGGRTTDVRTVTALAVKATFAGKEIVCRETKLFTRMDGIGMPARPPGKGTTGVELESDAVPGRKVRLETSGKGGPVSVTSVRELVAFEAKP